MVWLVLLSTVSWASQGTIVHVADAQVEKICGKGNEVACAFPEKMTVIVSDSLFRFHHLKAGLQSLDDFQSPEYCSRENKKTFTSGDDRFDDYLERCSALVHEVAHLVDPNWKVRELGSPQMTGCAETYATGIEFTAMTKAVDHYCQNQVSGDSDFNDQCWGACRQASDRAMDKIWDACMCHQAGKIVGLLTDKAIQGIVNQCSKELKDQNRIWKITPLACSELRTDSRFKKQFDESYSEKIADFVKPNSPHGSNYYFKKIRIKSSTEGAPPVDPSSPAN